MKVPTSNICVLCGENAATSREHIPPECIFLTPLPKNLITVPACNKCNTGSSEDDALFKMLLATFVGPSNTDVSKKFWERAKHTLQYKGNKRLRDNIRSKLRKVSVHTPDGLYLGKVPAINFKTKEIQPVIEKITKGLFFHYSGKILAKNAVLSISDIKQLSSLNPNAGFHNEVFKICAPHMSTKIICDEFCYKFGIADDAENSAMGFYQFYNAFYVTVITLDKVYASVKHPI